MIKGFAFSGVVAGIKKNGRKDLGLVVLPEGAQCYGSYTTNRVVSPTVTVTKERVKAGNVRALLTVAGNANACVRSAREDAEALTAAAASRLGLDPSQVLLATTGVIGVPMPVPKAVAAMDRLKTALGPDHASFATAITTTDAFEKIVTKTVTIDGVKITITGIGKGAGMIAPDMATMLMFLFTDARVSQTVLKKALIAAVDDSFNCISVDSDTSTNDMVLLFASGAAGNPVVKHDTKQERAFASAVKDVCIGLAKLVVSDGEGATKLLAITVKGARTRKDAKLAARCVAESLLVKTAFFGEDPNWGRIMAAVGRSGAKMDERVIDIDIAGMAVVRKGYEARGFDEKVLKAALSAKEIAISIDLRQGPEKLTFWASDLSYDYVKINASYRT